MSQPQTDNILFEKDMVFLLDNISYVYDCDSCNSHILRASSGKGMLIQSDLGRSEVD